MWGLCGEWAVDQLLSRNSPETIVNNAKAELTENIGRLFEVSPVFGAKLEREIDLENGVTLIPAEHVPMKWHAFNVMDNFQKSPFDPRDCCVLRQNFVVSPVFAVRSRTSDVITIESATTPGSDQRNSMRARVRAAMLLSCNSAIELPVSTRSRPRRPAPSRARSQIWCDSFGATSCIDRDQWRPFQAPF